MGSSTEHPVPAAHLAISKQRGEARVSYGDNYKYYSFLNEYEIDCVNALSKSPDLNPIEDWWTKISGAVFRDELSHNDRATLREAILRECPKLDAKKHKTVLCLYQIV
ncbi:MAG: hypothetical protein EZS28_020899 [Streblomastix strix]|uniref:Tc1-like transposase DDE domain-containing protein n=1 Tax=Streblomastix strix TaxID=222440 RepID=A0A5J4VM84_9EUKA|nr:MAG: hypothetical protein EZS28_020899 [Streblomastix strix]